MTARFEIIDDEFGTYKFQVRSRGGDILATSDPYPSKASAREGIASIRSLVLDGPVLDLTD
ncbi:YegP family protein [Mycolicibacterium lutetiense]|uniref:Uncharacterized protein YegP (UPF0339 family) n=1 Tax=Mycolicibacterium lutetiense TaxID=1641992 RepID=A0ABS4ZT19_9MYCO|nr:DUF1508 domain-containing protein [Mycolicibacterium lutetiense]MBP2452668.1 uncharacterized protein YegP (UPF0339 family) [Mycolicibacterium lutetiense]